MLIVSASMRDKGVRSKRIKLNPKHWLITDVPQWNVTASIDLLGLTNGASYDLRGEVATVLPGSPSSAAWFCSEWVAHPYLKAPATFGPHHLAAICMSVGEDVTDEFFGSRTA